MIVMVVANVSTENASAVMDSPEPTAPPVSRMTSNVLLLRAFFYSSFLIQVEGGTKLLSYANQFSFIAPVGKCLNVFLLLFFFFFMEEN